MKYATGCTMPSSSSFPTGFPFREKANSGFPRALPTNAFSAMTSDMAATATMNRKASSTVGAAVASAIFENIKLMPKMVAAVSAASSDRICSFFWSIGNTSFSLTPVSYHTPHEIARKSDHLPHCVRSKKGAARRGRRPFTGTLGGRAGIHQFEGE